jgi:hypothetical protein
VPQVGHSQLQQKLSVHEVCYSSYRLNCAKLACSVTA